MAQTTAKPSFGHVFIIAAPFPTISSQVEYKCVIKLMLVTKKINEIYIYNYLWPNDGLAVVWASFHVKVIFPSSFTCNA